MDTSSKLFSEEASLYYSFNSTSAMTCDSKQIEEFISTPTANDSTIDNSSHNSTLEPGIDLKTVVKNENLKISLSAVPKNILQEYKALSSTPTKDEIMKNVDFKRGSTEDLGIAFLETPQQTTHILFTDENKENQSKSEIYSSNDNVSSVIENKLEKLYENEKSEIKNCKNTSVKKLAATGKKNEKRIQFSNISALAVKNIAKPRKSCLPVQMSNGKIKEKQTNTNEATNIQAIQSSAVTSAEIPVVISKMNSILKMSGEEITKAPITNTASKLPANKDKLLAPFRRMSIAIKATPSSPVRKFAKRTSNVHFLRNEIKPRKSVIPAKVIENPSRKSIIPIKAEKVTTVPLENNILEAGVSKNNIQKPLKQTQHRMSLSVRYHQQQQQLLGVQEKLLKQKNSLNAVNNIKGLDLDCPTCSRKFRVKSMLEAHIKTHNDEQIANQKTTIHIQTNDRQCRFCDKKFAISKALNNHLIDNCTKIPPGEKKKLLICEEKQNLSQTSKGASRNFTSMSCPESGSADSISSRSETSRNASVDGVDAHQMGPPSVAKLRKKLPHTGVIRTPNKIIPCHICKLQFKSILSYTEHSMKHSMRRPSYIPSSSSAKATNIDGLVKDFSQTSLRSGN